MINVVQHKNTVLRLIELLYEENGLTDEACSVEKQELKNIIKNDFLELIFYPALDLTNVNKSLFVLDNQLEKLFSEPVTAETSVSQLLSSLTQEEIKSKKMEFIEKLKSKSSLLPQIIASQNSSDLVNFFSDIRKYNELFKHHGVKAMYHLLKFYARAKVWIKPKTKSIKMYQFKVKFIKIMEARIRIALVMMQ